VRRQAARPLSRLPQSTAGELVLDIGRQISGVCTFCFAGGAPAGARVDFRYGELLYTNGSVNGLTSVAGQVKSGNGGPCAPEIAFQEDHYIARGDAGDECFTPRFTWHAARYVGVTGDERALAALAATQAELSTQTLSDIVEIIGAVLFGTLAERTGRVRSAAASIGIMAVMAIACVFTRHYEALLALRFPQGIGIGGV
jgi:hypothetical protein